MVCAGLLSGRGFALATTISNKTVPGNSQRVAVGFGNCLYRRIQRLSTETIIFTARRGVVAFHDEWVIAIDHKSLDTRAIRFNVLTARGFCGQISMV